MTIFQDGNESTGVNAGDNAQVKSAVTPPLLSFCYRVRSESNVFQDEIQVLATEGSALTGFFQRQHRRSEAGIMRSSFGHL